MKLQLLAIFLLPGSLSAAAKDSTIISVKTLAVGMKYRGDNTRRLSDLLLAEGYEAPNGPVPLFMLTQSVTFPDRLGFYYSLEFGRDKKENAGRSVARLGYGAGIGASCLLYERTAFGVTGHLGVNGSWLELRTYDESADTISLAKYTATHSGNEKRIIAQGFGPALGADVQTRMLNFWNARLGLSYTFPVARADIGSDAGSFKNPPAVHTATLEAHLQLQLSWVRRKAVCLQSHNPFM